MVAAQYAGRCRHRPLQIVYRFAVDGFTFLRGAMRASRPTIFSLFVSHFKRRNRLIFLSGMFVPRSTTMIHYSFSKRKTPPGLDPRSAGRRFETLNQSVLFVVVDQAAIKNNLSLIICKRLNLKLKALKCVILDSISCYLRLLFLYARQEGAGRRTVHGVIRLLKLPVQGLPKCKTGLYLRI